MCIVLCVQMVSSCVERALAHGSTFWIVDCILQGRHYSLLERATDTDNNDQHDDHNTDFDECYVSTATLHTDKDLQRHYQLSGLDLVPFEEVVCLVHELCGCASSSGTTILASGVLNSMLEAVRHVHDKHNAVAKSLNQIQIKSGKGQSYISTYGSQHFMSPGNSPSVTAAAAASFVTPNSPTSRQYKSQNSSHSLLPTPSWYRHPASPGTGALDTILAASGRSMISATLKDRSLISPPLSPTGLVRGRSQGLAIHGSPGGGLSSRLASMVLPKSVTKSFTAPGSATTISPALLYPRYALIFTVM